MSREGCGFRPFCVLRGWNGGTVGRWGGGACLGYDLVV